MMHKNPLLGNKKKLNRHSMLIDSITNSTGGKVMRCDKSISTLILVTSHPFDQLTNETISLEVITPMGENKEITRGSVSLPALMVAASYGEDASVPTADGKFITTISLTPDGGAYNLQEKEFFQISISKTQTTRTYEVYGFEEPVYTGELVRYENKTCNASDTVVKWDVSDSELVVLDDHSTITEIRFQWENGVQTTHTVAELRFMNASNDPIRAISATGAVSILLAGKIALPVAGIESIEVRKDAGQVLNLLIVR